MKNVNFPVIASLGRSLLGQVRIFHAKPPPIVIVTAVRTPCGKYHSQLALLSAWQLGQTAVEAAVKRSAVPLEQIHHIFMNETQILQQEHEHNFIFTHFLKKAKYKSIRLTENTAMDAFQMALEFVRTYPQAVAVAGGSVSSTNNQKIENSVADNKNELIEKYVEQSLARYTKSESEGEFDSELVPLIVHKQRGQSRVIEEIYHDEICLEECKGPHITCQHSAGASAVVLTSVGNAQELKLAPLAEIKGVEYIHTTANILPTSIQVLEKLFAEVGVQPHQIKHWEIDGALPELVHHVEQTFNLNPVLINPHGSSLILGHSPTTLFTRLLTHISHALNPSEYGCVICSSYKQTSLLIMEKLCQTQATHPLPMITVYTKNPCPLCDMLVEELELNFADEYELEKVFIDTKENVRFLRLYRHDIPVVFLNNQFLCMHRLKHRLLRKRLDLLKNNHL